MVETTDVRALEEAAGRVVDRLTGKGFPLRTAFLVVDGYERWWLYIVPNDVGGPHWQGYHVDVARDVTRVEEELLNGQSLHFSVVHERTPEVASVRALTPKNAPRPTRVTGYDGRMFIERAIVFRDAA